MSKKKKKKKNINNKKQSVEQSPVIIDMSWKPDNHPHGEVILEKGTFYDTRKGYMFRPDYVDKMLHEKYTDLEEWYAQDSKVQDGDICFFGGRDFLVATHIWGFGGGYYKGKVANITKKKNDIVFKKLYCGFEESDGRCVDGTVDHVHILEADAFIKEGIVVGDCVSFSADTYPYKRRNGTYDFGLKNCWDIEKIESYEIPTEEELREQFIESLVCEVCLQNEHCYGMCIANEEWREQMIKTLMEAANAFSLDETVDPDEEFLKEVPDVVLETD